MTAYPVSGCVYRFESQFGLVQVIEDSTSEQPSSIDSIDKQDTNLLEKTVFNYSKKENCCEKVSRFFYLVWQAVKRLFCGSSDWQNTTRMLSDRLVKNFEYGAMTAEQRKAVTADVDLVAEQFLLQLLDANEKGMSDLDGFETRTSSHKGELYGDSSKKIFSCILRTLAQNCLVTKNCNDFIKQLPIAIQNKVNGKFKAVSVPEKLEMIQAFEGQCAKDPKYAEETIKKISENYSKMAAIDNQPGYCPRDKLEERNQHDNATDTLLKQAFGIDSMFNGFS
jgi:hypothetical protein